MLLAPMCPNRSTRRSPMLMSRTWLTLQTPAPLRPPPLGFCSVLDPETCPHSMHIIYKNPQTSIRGSQLSHDSTGKGGPSKNLGGCRRLRVAKSLQALQIMHQIDQGLPTQQMQPATSVFGKEVSTDADSQSTAGLPSALAVPFSRKDEDELREDPAGDDDRRGSVNNILAYLGMNGGSCVGCIS